MASIIPPAAAADATTFGVFGSYAIVEDVSSRSGALPTAGKRPRPTRAAVGGGGSGPVPRSIRRPAPASLRLEAGASPYGVAPEGCALLPGADPPSRGRGLGAMRALADDLVLYLLAWLDARTLSAFSATSGAAYAFAHAGETWRNLALAAARVDGLARDGGAPYASGWTTAPDWKSALMAKSFLSSKSKYLRLHTPIRVRGVYSDLLFKHAACAGSAIAPSWSASDSLLRVADGASLSAAQFTARYEGRPVVLEGAAPWSKNALWSQSQLATAGGSSLFHCGGVRMTLSDYFGYTSAMGGRDDRPLYLFERNFAQLAPSLADAFTTPAAIPPDLHSVLPDDSPLRPDHTWLIAGPRKSGSTFHKDPNASCAWNACVRGLKAWVFYPPHTAPPGVVVGGGLGGEGSDVATPVSVLEWYADHWPAHLARAKRGGADAPVAGLQRPGDVVVVPAGWWHQVLNLEDSVAVTHNCVTPSGLSDALELARDDPAAISGVPEALQESFYSVWRAALQTYQPDFLKAAEMEEAERVRAAPPPPPAKGGKWAALTTKEPTAAGGFSLMASWGLQAG